MGGVGGGGGQYEEIAIIDQRIRKKIYRTGLLSVISSIQRVDRGQQLRLAKEKHKTKHTKKTKIHTARKKKYKENYQTPVKIKEISTQPKEDN